jgi:transcriptional regulator with XRE-family HTH domain
MIYKHALADVIRNERIAQGRTLRSVSSKGMIGLTYLWEVENARKEISSELLEGLAKSLGVPTHEIVIRAGMLMAGVEVPDTIESLLDNYTDTLVR